MSQPPPSRSIQLEAQSRMQSEFWAKDGTEEPAQGDNKRRKIDFRYVYPLAPESQITYASPYPPLQQTSLPYAPAAMSRPTPVRQLQQPAMPSPPAVATAQPQADEWTEVTTKSKSKSKRRRKSPPPTTNTPPAPKVRNPPSKNINLARIQADFNSKTKAWQKSDCRKSTHAILDKIQPDAGWSIEKAVCLGVGSFSRENGECRKRSMWQFVVFVDTVRHLQRIGKRDIEIYVQEPQFTETDKAFLKTLRIHVLDVDPLPDPVAEGYMNTAGLGAAVIHMGQETFLFEPFMDMNEAMLKEIIEADVELYVGSSVRGLMGRWGAVGDLARVFEGQHGVYQFPRFEEDPNVLEGMGVYWKPENEDEG